MSHKGLNSYIVVLGCQQYITFKLRYAYILFFFKYCRFLRETHKLHVRLSQIWGLMNYETIVGVVMV